MCIFSAPVSTVANTSIFARSSNDGKQFLVYSMHYQANSELAMILPLPTPPLPPEDAVRFIDLSGYPEFFAEMAKGFVMPKSRSHVEIAAPASLPTLKVHEVGSFQASFVPHQRDFTRLDSRFRLPDQTWEQLPQYNHFAFAVFKLQAGTKDIHPMAFEFPRKNPHELFFPTVHVHEGIVEAKAHFDHSLYCQIPQRQVDRGRRFSLNEPPRNDSIGPAKQFMNITKTQGIIEADLPIQLQRLTGIYANRDMIVQEKSL